MNEYLVMYKPDNANNYQPSIHIWPETLAMLKKKEEIGGTIRVYDLRCGNPQRLVIGHTKNEYWLENLYGIHVEG